MQGDDDPVIKEIPVYLSKMLAEKLYVFQYPVRSRGVGYEDSIVLKSCIKPQHQEVKLELEMDTRSSSYDISKGEQLAVNVDGAGKNADPKKSEEKCFQSDLMDKQILQSTRSVQDTSKYAVAVLHDNELHITPLQGIIHLRPSFSYLDKSDKRAKEEAKEHGEGDLSEEEEEAKQVTVKFARQENERIKRARERSYGYLSKKSAEEPWFYTEFHHSSTEKAELECGKLYCSKTAEHSSELSLKIEDYTKCLVPSEDMIEEPSNASSDVIPLSSLKLLPLVDQVKFLIREAKLLPFSQLASVLGQNADTVGLLRTVQQVAVLVQGNWVVRSDVLYPKDTFSSISGVPAELMCRGRDYILYLFTQNLYVDRRKVCCVVKLPSEEITEILVNIAILHPKKGWELQLCYNKDFITRYPEVVQRQQMWWDAKQKQLSEAFKEDSYSSPGKSSCRSNRGSSVSDNELSGDSKLLAYPQNPKTSHRESFSSDNESGAEGGVVRHKRNKTTISSKIPRKTAKQSNLIYNTEVLET